MGIKVDNQKNLFHIQGKSTSYIMQVLDGGYLAHLYYGARINEYRGSNKIIYLDRGFSPNPCDKDRSFFIRYNSTRISRIWQWRF